MIDLKVETLKRSWLFLEYPEEKLAQLSANSFFKKIKRGQILFNQGDVPDYLHIVSSGIVKQFKVSLSGKVFTIVMNSCGDTLNMFALFGRKSHFVSVTIRTRGPAIVRTRGCTKGS